MERGAKYSGRSKSRRGASIAAMTRADEAPLRVENMTSRQLVRRAKLIEAITELVEEVGGQAVQMQDVARRSGVALGTAYRYFRSKDHLLAAAMVEWQQRFFRRMMLTNDAAGQEPISRVADYLERSLKAFHRNPEMAALMVRTLTSCDPDVLAALKSMNEANAELFGQLLAGIAEADASYVTYALEATMVKAAAAMVTGQATLAESIDNAVGVAHTLLGDSLSPRTPQ
jgi:TetR/AcrR family transcriptional regulator, cholesterol catabolism regulator